MIKSVHTSSNHIFRSNTSLGTTGVPHINLDYQELLGFFPEIFFQWTATLIHVVKWLGFSLIYIFCQTVYKLNIGVFTLKKKNSVMWNSQKLINLDNCSKIHYSVDLRVPVFCRGQDCLLHFLICSRLTQGINQGISNKWSRYCFLRTKVLT